MHTIVTVGELELWMVGETYVHAQLTGPISAHVCVVSQSQFLLSMWWEVLLTDEHNHHTKNCQS